MIKTINILNRTTRVYLLALVLLAGMPSMAFSQIFKIAHPDTTVGNGFGTSVAVEGNRALIGASAEDVCGPNSGAAYIYERDAEDESWKAVTRLVPSTCVEGGFFGRSLSIYGDRAVVAASSTFPNQNSSNAAYIFERDEETGDWKEIARIKQFGDEEEGSFASAVSLDENRLLITTSGDPIRQEYNGAAYIYELAEDNRWVQKARLTGTGSLADGVFGGAGALDGDYAVVTASKYYEEEPGSLFIFERNESNGDWQRVKHIKGIDDIFISVDIEGNYVLVGESRGGSRRSGLATLYERQDDGDWELIQTLRPRVPYKDGAFGSAVSFDGENALVAGYDEQLGKNFNIDRVVYEFKRKSDSDEWTQRRIFDVGTVAFGYSIATSDGFAVIGEVSDQEPGAAYVIEIH